MAEAVTLSKIGATADVNAALGIAATHHRFANGDLASILNANTRQPETHAAAETKSLAQGTGGWAAISAQPAAVIVAGLEESA